MRAGTSGGRGGHGRGGSGVGGARKGLQIAPLVCPWLQAGEADWLALGERRARALAVFERKDCGAIEAAGSGDEQRGAAKTGGADSAGREGRMEGQAQAAAPAGQPWSRRRRRW
eukprot:2139530-Prymnesium_polylepis.1